MISRNSNNAKIRYWRKVFDYIRDIQDISDTLDYMKENSLVRDIPTAPQPTSPKFKITLCFKADQICLLVKLSVAFGPVVLSDAFVPTGSQGMNSTRSQRFCGLISSN